MTVFRQKCVGPKSYEIAGHKVSMHESDLKVYAHNTNQAISAGINVPIYPAHTQPGDPRGGFLRSKKDARDNLGWCLGFEVADDGYLEGIYDVTNPEAEAAIRNGSIKFSSPEFVQNYRSDGKYHGDVIRHAALTATPRCKVQGPFMASGSATATAQFSEADRMDNPTTFQFAEEPDKFKKAAKDEPPGVGPDATNTSEPASENPNTKAPPGEETDESAGPIDNPQADDQETNVVETSADGEDLTESGTAGQVAELIAKIQETMGIDVPAGADAVAVLTAIHNIELGRIKAQSDSEGLMDVEEEPQIQQFSEEAQAVIADRDAELKTLRASAKMDNLKRARTTLVSKIKGARLWPALRDRLITQVSTTAFSDDGSEEIGMTIGGMLSAVQDTMPTSLQFDDADVSVMEHPNAGEFFNDDPAKGPVKESDEQSASEAEKALQQAGIITEETREPVYQYRNRDPETGPTPARREREPAGQA